MSIFSKYAPYLYFILAILLLINTIDYFNKDLKEYQIIFNFTVDNKYSYAVYKSILIVLIIFLGFLRLKKNKNEKKD